MKLAAMASLFTAKYKGLGFEEESFEKIFR